MARLTHLQDGAWTVADRQAALDKLAAYEDLAQELAGRQARLAAQLADLRARGQSRSAHFRELLAEKLTNGQLLALLQARGLDA